MLECHQLVTSMTVCSPPAEAAMTWAPSADRAKFSVGSTCEQLGWLSALLLKWLRGRSTTRFENANSRHARQHAAIGMATDGWRTG